LILFISSHTLGILGHLDFCDFQILCPVCSTYIAIDRWDAHRRAHGRERASQPTTSTFNISIDATSFDSFFNHEGSLGERLTVIQRATIVALHSLNLRNDMIAHLTHCDPRTIQHWVDYYNERQSLQDESRSGRPRVTSEDIDTSIVAAATETPITTPRIIRSELGIDASVRTIRRRLDEAGLFGRVARISYPFTDEHIEQRLAFANRHQNWDESKWDTVLFSDETHIVLGGSGQVWVQRPEDTAFLAQYMAHQDPFPQKISVWGCFSSKGIGPIRIIEDTMNSRVLTDTFNRCMLPKALEWWPNEQWYLLQDNAPYHSSNETKNWLHRQGIDCIDFPAYSPDLNPIENLWGDLKRRIELHRPSNITELKEILEQEWNSTDPNNLAILSSSMIDRCQEVVSCGGFKTKY
jgi:transposase